MPKRKTTEEYKNEVERVTNNEYTILTEYKTANDKILFKHLKCGREYYATPKNFNKGRRCAHCSNNKAAKTTESFKEEVRLYGNNEYELVSEYGMNNKEKVTLLHKNCNNEFQITPYNFLNGHGCPFCYKRNNLKTTEQFKEEVTKLSNNEYEVLSEYTGWNNKITFLHKTCNKQYKATPTKFIIGRRCPYCSESKGEIKIRTFLDEHNIKYKR